MNSQTKELKQDSKYCVNNYVLAFPLALRALVSTDPTQMINDAQCSIQKSLEGKSKNALGLAKDCLALAMLNKVPSTAADEKQALTLLQDAKKLSLLPEAANFLARGVLITKENGLNCFDVGGKKYAAVLQDIQAKAAMALSKLQSNAATTSVNNTSTSVNAMASSFGPALLPPPKQPVLAAKQLIPAAKQTASAKASTTILNK